MTKSETCDVILINKNYLDLELYKLQIIWKLMHNKNGISLMVQTWIWQKLRS